MIRNKTTLFAGNDEKGYVWKCVKCNRELRSYSINQISYNALLHGQMHDREKERKKNER